MKNVFLMSEKTVMEIEKEIGYVFKDKSLLIQAFTRTSYCNEANLNQKIKLQSNEVLEFFGDTVLSAAIVTHLMKEKTVRYTRGIKTDLSEGDFSNIKSKLSDKRNLSLSMKKLGLEKHLIMGEGDKKLNVMNEPSVMEDLFESIVGAIYIDSENNMTAVLCSVTKMLDLNEYLNSKPPIQSAKNALQEWCADKRRRLSHPRYETVGEHGPDHKKVYERGCYIDERLVATGMGKNLKLADAVAAENALKILMNEEEATKTKPQKQSFDNKGLQNNKKSSNSDKSNKAKQNSQKAKQTGVEQDAKTKQKDKQAKPSLPKVTQEAAAAYLRAVSLQKKVPTPGYRDLGQISDGQHKISCEFMGQSTIGVGKDRASARHAATVLMFKQVKSKKSNS